MVGDKEHIRRQVKACRDAISPADRQSLSARICSRALGCIDRLSPPRVALYASTGSEVITQALFTELVDRHVAVLFPRCRTASDALEFVPVRSLDELAPGAHRLLEPTGPAVPL